MATNATSHSLIARRYAEPLFELAEGPALDVVSRDMARLREMLGASADLRRAVASPLVSRAQGIAAIESVAAEAGFSDLTKKFLGVVAHNGRLAALDGIAAAFLAEVAARRGLKEVEIISARPLDDTRRAAIEHELNAALSAKTTLTVTVDPAILGGMIVRVGSRLIDASVKTKLDRLGRILKTAA